MGANVDLGRRRFLLGRPRHTPTPPRPPWLADAALERCTGCGACAAACPQDIVACVDGRPRLDFARGECTFCGACAEACPEALFDRAGPAFGHVAAIGESCLTAQGVVCQSCGDACPTRAIRFAPRRGGPFRPALDVAACTGCGACVAPCPAAAIATVPRDEAAHG